MGLKVVNSSHGNCKFGILGIGGTFIAGIENNLFMKIASVNISSETTKNAVRLTNGAFYYFRDCDDVRRVNVDAVVKETGGD